LKEEMAKHVRPAMADSFPFAGRRCQRLTQAVLARLNLAS
jgi:RNA polymerase sigma-70 factor (ECF subfamily)